MYAKTDKPDQNLQTTMYAKIDKVNLNKKFKGDKSEYLLTTNYIF